MPSPLGTLAYRLRAPCPSPDHWRWLTANNGCPVGEEREITPCAGCRGEGTVRPLLRECPFGSAAKHRVLAGTYPNFSCSCAMSGLIPFPEAEARGALEQALLDMGYSIQMWKGTYRIERQEYMTWTRVHGETLEDATLQLPEAKEPAP